MAEQGVLLVVGASGAAAMRVAEQALVQGWDVIGLSRQALPAAGAGAWIAADLVDPTGLARGLSQHPTITHIVYSARASHGETGVEDHAANVGMMRNLLDAAEAVLPGLRHIHLVQGGKWYGMHLGSYRTPAKEDDPPHGPGNFYHHQQDLVADRQRGRHWTWSASRPSFVCDFAPGRARNLVSTLGAYAALCREHSLPLDFPGKPGTWTALIEVTEAKLLARGILWMLTEPACSNQAFNLTNGDSHRWCDIWPRLAALFELPLGNVRPMLPITRWMADKEEAWGRIMARHRLRLPLAQVANWNFADFVLGLDHDVLSSTSKLRRCGFHEAVDTMEMIEQQVAAYRIAQILP